MSIQIKEKNLVEAYRLGIIDIFQYLELFRKLQEAK